MPGGHRFGAQPPFSKCAPLPQYWFAASAVRQAPPSSKRLGWQTHALFPLSKSAPSGQLDQVQRPFTVRKQVLAGQPAVRKAQAPSPNHAATTCFMPPVLALVARDRSASKVLGGGSIGIPESAGEGSRKTPKMRGSNATAAGVAEPGHLATC